MPPESYWAKEYFNDADDYFDRNIDIIEKFLGNNCPKKALDIGAGIGKCMIALNKRGIDYGIEPSNPFYLRAIDVMKIDPNKLKLTTIENAQFPEHFFDFITDFPFKTRQVILI